jgi:SlyX protein
MTGDPRLTQLETRYTELEHLVEELNQVIYRQQQQLDALTKTVAQLQEKLRAEPGLVDAATDEKPPHY